MPSVNETIAQSDIRQNVELQRLGRGTTGKVLSILKGLDEEILRELITAEGERKTHMEAKLRIIRTLINEAYNADGGVFSVIDEDLRDLADYQLDYSHGTLHAVLGDRAVKPALDRTISAAVAKPFEGRHLRDWYRSLEASERNSVYQAVRRGYANAETIEQIVRRVRGTKVRNFKDGALAIPKRHAETVVRTALSHFSNHTRSTVWNNNADLIKKLQLKSVLDGRTSDICIRRSNKLYDLGKEPALPFHPNERSTYIPILKSFRELGIDRDELPESTQFARGDNDGQVPDSLSYEGWFKTQSAKFQRETLGGRKYTLWKKGELSLTKFADASGRTRTSAELKRLFPSAFEKAGLE